LSRLDFDLANMIQVSNTGVAVQKICFALAKLD